MKKELSSVDLHYLVQEFQQLLNGKVDQVLQPERNELILSFFISGKGKSILRIVVPSFIFLAKEKRQSSENPMALCSLLRKYLINSKLLSITQIKSERALMLDFKGKEQDYHLVIELFSKGNIIFCGQGMKIMGLLEEQEWKSRSIKKGIEYKSPERDVDFFDLSKEHLSSILERSIKDNIGAILAVELGLGGQYSEEACLIANVAKEENPKGIDEKKIDALYSAIKQVVGHKLEPRIIMKDEKIIDVVPFPLTLYEKHEQAKKESFNEAVDEYFNTALPTMAKESIYDKKIRGMQGLIEKQEEQLKTIEETYRENVQKGELLYEKYQIVDTLLKEIKSAKEKHSWKEIKERLAKFGFVKEIRENEGKIILEI